MTEQPQIVYVEAACLACGCRIAVRHGEEPVLLPLVFDAHRGPVVPIELGLLYGGELHVWQRR